MGDFCPVGYEGTADHCFTGKEDDVEVGLIYFGKRYYAPLLQRWISADPLAVHAPGEADLNLYAYVHGQVLRAVDPVGLQQHAAPAAGSTPNPGAPPPTVQKGAGPKGGDITTLAEVKIEGRVESPPAPTNPGNGKTPILGAFYPSSLQLKPLTNPTLASQPQWSGLARLNGDSSRDMVTGSGHGGLATTATASAVAASPYVAAHAQGVAEVGGAAAAAVGRHLVLNTPRLGQGLGFAHQYAFAEASGGMALGGGGLVWKMAGKGGGGAVAREFSFFNPANRSNGIVASVQDGVLSTAIEATGRNRIPGSQLFMKAVEHFGRKSIRGVRGSWSYGDNLGTLNKLTGEGMSVADAARQTFTGRMAGRLGFSNVEVLSTAGESGNFTNVQVLFK